MRQLNATTGGVLYTEGFCELDQVGFLLLRQEVRHARHGDVGLGAWESGNNWVEECDSAMLVCATTMASLRGVVGKIMV